jgi:hypothetical protein
MVEFYDNDDRERLYKDIEGSRYITWHSELTRAIYNKYKVSGLDICIFETITMYYDSHKQQPYKGSFADLAKLCNCNRSSVVDSIHALLQWKLIMALDSDKTNTKLEYIPNVKQLHKILVAYISTKHTNAPKIKRCKMEAIQADKRRGQPNKVTPPEAIPHRQVAGSVAVPSPVNSSTPEAIATRPKRLSFEERRKRYKEEDRRTNMIVEMDMYINEAILLFEESKTDAENFQKQWG